MDSKEYLLTILTKLETKRDLAKGLKFLIEEGQLDENLIEIIKNTTEEAINTTINRYTTK